MIMPEALEEDETNSAKAVETTEKIHHEPKHYAKGQVAKPRIGYWARRRPLFSSEYYECTHLAGLTLM